MQSTINNRTIFCKDNLEILKGINTETIDLIYLDPPFNKKKEFTAPIGSSAEGAGFKDWFREEDVKDEWVKSIKEDYDGIYEFLTSIKQLSSIQNTKKNTHYLYNYCYLSYMAIRLIEMHRILKDTGSIYLHCDPTMSHYLKILLDLIFGEQNFRNEIVWGYRTGGVSKKHLPRKHDILLCYGKTRDVYHNPMQETILYNKPFFTKIQSNEDGKYPVQVYVRDVWDDEIKPVINVSRDRTDYPTQKPRELLERILNISSNEGDVVLDPFCGCATTCVAAEKLNRQWIGVDISVKAYELVQIRIKDEVYAEGLLKGEDGNLPSIHFRTDPPQRTDKDLDQQAQKYVYVISNKKWKGEYKVGIASNVKSRLNSYQIGDPDREYKLEYSMLTPYYREVEAYIHAKFNNKHEWVSGALSDIINEMEKYKPRTSDLFNE